VIGRAPVTFFNFNFMTLDQIVAAIQNNVGVGLKEVWNYPYSREQLWDEISNIRSQTIYNLSKRDKLDPADFAQTPKDNFEIVPGPYPTTAFNETGYDAYTTYIPKLAQTLAGNPIVYLGPADMSLNMIVYTTIEQANSHKYSRVIKNRPYAVIGVSQNGEGDLPVYLFNLGPAPFRYLTVRAVFDDPVKVLEEKDGVYAGEQEFPAPLGVQENIIDVLSDKYITYYRKLAHPNEPNDQTDKH